MRKCFKIVLIIAVFVLVLSALENFSLATTWETRVGDMLKKSNEYKDSSATKSAQNAVGAVITITRSVATGVAIIMLIVLAMKYMTAAPGDRADIKKHAVVYVVGAVVLFAASGILGIIANFADKINA